MKPDEIIDKLVSFVDLPKQQLHAEIATLRPHLTDTILRELSRHIVQGWPQNLQDALQFLEVVDATAVIMATDGAQARAFNIRGAVLYHFNHYEEATSFYEKAEMLFHSEGDLEMVMGTQCNRAASLCNLGRYPEALAVAHRSLATYKTQTTPNEYFFELLQSTFGWVYEEMGEYELSFAAYEQCRQSRVKQGNLLGVAQIDNNLAYLLKGMDRVEEAEALFISSRKIRVQEDSTRGIAQSDTNLGALARQRGQLQQAMTYLEQAHTGYAMLSLPMEVANVNYRRAEVYWHLNLLPESISLAAKSARVMRQYKMQRELFQCLEMLSRSYGRLGLTDKALRYLNQARRIANRQQAYFHLLKIDAERAALMLAQRRIATARRIIRRVAKHEKAAYQPALLARLHLLEARCTLVAADDTLAAAQTHVEQALDLAHTYQMSDIQIQAHQLLGELAERDGQAAMAQSHYRQALEQCEATKAYLSLDEFHIGFLDDKLPLYQDHVRLTHHLTLVEKLSPAYLLYALNLAQSAPLLHSAATAAPDADPSAELQTLREQWRWYQNRLEAEKTRDRAEIGRKLKQVEAEMADLLRRQRVRQTIPQSHTFAVEDWNPDGFLTDLQAHLPPEVALLQFYRAEGAFHALLVTATAVHLIPDLVDIRVLQRQQKAWHFFIRHQTTTGTEMTTQAQAHLTRFYQALLHPCLSYLNQITHLYLSLPPEWHDIPLAALFDGRAYLAERFALTYLSAPESLLNQSAATPHHTPDNTQALVISCSDNGRLTHTQAEAETIAAGLQEKWQVTCLLEAESEAMQAAVAEAHLLHLATHATFRPDNPYFSWMRLADKRLTVADLYEMRLPQRPLVVLSACETGKGQPQGGGLLGMGRAFLAAGASGLVVTNWQVDDEKTAQLMADFYIALIGMNGAAALQYAQQRAIERGWSPFYWAGFVYIGG